MSPAIDAGLRRAARPGRRLYSFMRRVLATPHRLALYRRRQITIEHVFGQANSNAANGAADPPAAANGD